MTDNNFDWLFDDDSIQTTETLDAPVKLERAVQQRVFVNGLKKQALNQLIPELPPENVDVYILGTGADAGRFKRDTSVHSFDFGTFLPHLIDLLGGENITVYLSSWTINRNHVMALLEALRDGQIGKLTFFSDPSFMRRESPVHSLLLSELRNYPDRARYLAFLNHCKIMALSAPDGSRCATVTGSGNLTQQPRCEQYNLTTSKEVYQFYVQSFFETMWEKAHGG